MSDSINNYFAFDTGIYNWEEIFENRQASYPKTQKSTNADIDSYQLPSSILKIPGESLGYQIDKIILSVIEDSENIDAAKFSEILIQTLTLIESECEIVIDPKIHQSLTDLTELLKENTELTSIFQSYTNWLQRA